MKKKVFFIMSTDDYSGAETVNFNIIDSLKDKYDFYWVSRRGNINDFLEENHIKWIEISKLSVKEIKRVIREYNPDILHATDFRASSICSLAHGTVPLIEHLHNNALWIKKICINSFIFLFAGLKADKILTVSDAISKEYVFSKHIDKKIMCVGNPVSRDKILNLIDKKEVNKEYDICCVARLTEAKNPLLFVEIIASLIQEYPNLKSIWVGDGEYKDKTIEEAKRLNVLNNIEFVGYQKNPYDYMKKAKIFMLTSKWEGYGLVAFEALTLGLPCIVSNVGGLPGIVNDKCGYICDNKDDYIDAVKELMSDSNKYNLLTKEAVSQSKRLDNISEYMKKIESVYEGVLEIEDKS